MTAVMGRTFPVKIICGCSQRIVLHYATDLVRALDGGRAPETLLLQTVKCYRCKDVHEIRLGDLRWRPIRNPRSGTAA